MVPEGQMGIPVANTGEIPTRGGAVPLVADIVAKDENEGYMEEFTWGGSAYNQYRERVLDYVSLEPFGFNNPT